MKSPFAIVALGFAVFAGLGQAAPQQPIPPVIERLAEDYLDKREAQGFAKKMSLPEALLMQKLFVKRLEASLGRPIGYKVGLVSREMQQRFGLETPVRGVLLEKMLLSDGAEVAADFGVHPLFEADLIVVVKDPAINKAASVFEVAEHLKEVVAFIELPDSFLSTNKPIDGAALIASNVGARLGVLGQRLPVKATPEFIKALAEMTATIVDDRGVELGKAQGKVILDQPLNAVLWLIEELHKSGERLKAGDLLSLGSLKAIPLPAGKTVTVRYDGLPGAPIQVSVRIR